MDVISAIFGLAILLLAGDALVRGAVNLSLRLGVPALIVSLTIVALGTSAPELLISIRAILRGAPGLAMGNVVGSNTANILLVLGLPALMCGLATGAHDTRRSYVFMLAASVWFITLCFFGPLTWVHGLLLLGALAGILLDHAFAVRVHRRADAAAAADLQELEGADPEMPWRRILLYLALGLVGLPLGAEVLVGAAVNIATRMGVSETVIGLTLIAVGTSLPELATTVMAALRNNADVALGNVIGSNMFNLLAVIGLSTFFGSIPVDPAFLKFDHWVMLAASVALAPFVLRKINMTRIVGAGFTGLYGLYIFASLKWGI